MNILDLAEELNLSPRRAASTKGGEYKSKCPKCQTGADRFCIWPNKGESGGYWCRVCDCRGDGIQFCRDFLGMTFQEACQKMQVLKNYTGRDLIYKLAKAPRFVPCAADPVHPEWQKRAEEFICRKLDLI